MHEKRPDIYKDPNPKPEIAIALSDDFEACFGFVDEETLNKNVAQNPALKVLFSNFIESSEQPHSESLKQITEGLFCKLDLEK